MCIPIRFGHSGLTKTFWPQSANQYVFATVGTQLCLGHSVHTNTVWPKWAHQHILASLHTNMYWPVCTPLRIGHSGHITVCWPVHTPIHFDNSEHSTSNKLHNVQAQQNFSTLSLLALTQTDHNLTCTTVSQNKVTILTAVMNSSLQFSLLKFNINL